MAFESQKNSASSNSTTNETVSKPVTLQDVTGATFAGNDMRAGGNISVIDGGAIQAMKDLGEKFLDQQNRAEGQFLTFANDASKSAMNFAFDAGRPDQATTKWLLVAAVAAVAVWAFAKGK
jgi:hypothetical protein